MKHLPFVFIALIALASGCSNSGDSAKEKMYDVHGKVIAVDIQKKEVTLDHDAIPGLMGAMKMPFKVENAKVLDGINAGDKIHGRLKVKDGQQTITELMKH